MSTPSKYTVPDRSSFNPTSAFEHKDAIRHRPQRVRNVLDPDDRVIGLDRLDDRNEAFDLRFGQAGGDFIEQDQFGLRRQCLGEFKPLAVDQRQRTGKPVRLCVEPGPPQHLHGP